jgi:transposase
MASGKRHWLLYFGRRLLFAGSDDSGERAAVTYTLTGSAKLNSLAPELYLRQVPGAHIANHPIPCISDSCPGISAYPHRPLL